MIYRTRGKYADDSTTDAVPYPLIKKNNTYPTKNILLNVLEIFYH